MQSRRSSTATSDSGHECIPAEPLWAVLDKLNCNYRKPDDAARIAEIMQLFGFTRKQRVYVKDEQGQVKQKMCWLKDLWPEGKTLDWDLPSHLRAPESDAGM